MAAIGGVVTLARAELLQKAHHPYWTQYFRDEGFRRGDGPLLAVMAYATPPRSALLLAAPGAALLTWNQLTGAVVIVIAGLLSRADSALR